MRKGIRIVVMIIAAMVFLYYAFKLVTYMVYSEMNRVQSEELVLEVVTVNEDFWETDEDEFEDWPDGSVTDPVIPEDTPVTDPSVTDSGTGTDSDTKTSGSSDSAAKDTASKTPRKNRRQETPISVDFNIVQRKNEDAIAWLYQENTQIHYPIMQSTDNDYYLRRSFDRKYSTYGCLFLDYRCAADFTDNLSTVYGHEARNGSMFGSLAGYKKQEYYDTHKIMYLLTPDVNYRVRIFAGCIVRTDSIFFKMPVGDDEIAELIHEAIVNSTFRSDVKEEEIGPVLMLSTCTYEFADARYLVFGSLEKIKGN